MPDPVETVRELLTVESFVEVAAQLERETIAPSDPERDRVVEEVLRSLDGLRDLPPGPYALTPVDE